MTNYGLQMYSIRDEAKVDLKNALRCASEMGYRYIEFADFFENEAKDVKEWLDEYGLIACGTHTALSELLPEKIEATIAYHKTIGCSNLIIPAASWRTEEKFEQNIAIINQAQKKLDEAGITLSYHNHSTEFFVTPYGKVIEEELLERTNVMLEIDVFWLYNAGIDPVSYCEKIKDRICMIHLKDGKIAKNIEKSFANAHDGVEGLSLGLGEVPIKAIRKWAIENGFFMVVESEGLNPTGPEEVQRCMDYLKTLEA